MSKADFNFYNNLSISKKVGYKKWLKGLNKEHSKTNHYGVGKLEDICGFYSWFGYFEGEYSPECAILEDLSYWY